MPTIPNDAPRIIAMAISLKINANKPLSGDEEIINDPDLNPNYYFDEVTTPMNRSPEPHAPQAKTPKNSNVTLMASTAAKIPAAMLKPTTLLNNSCLLSMSRLSSNHIKR